MTRIRCLAIDDEPMALKKLENYINKTPFLECFRNGHVKERLSKEHTDHVRQLCGMANNLNQLARKANAGGFSEVGWDCKVAVARIHELISKIGI